MNDICQKMTKFDVLVVPDEAVKGADSEAPLTLFSLNHPRTGNEVRDSSHILRACVKIGMISHVS